MNFRRGLRVPPLSKYIQGILAQYPDDGQILKELIQNADDAGATTIKLLLDETQYSTTADGLVHPQMDTFQGPSLLVYNDAVFTEADWNAICMMQESIKKDDVIKTGRFGLGFKSIFHVTDLPTILSGDYIGFIDPHERYLPKGQSAYNWHLEEDQEFLQSKEKQFEPLFHNLFGSSKDILTTNSYKYTLFRFPLRNQSSDLSGTQYTCDKVLQLFQSLQQDNGQSLLFLKSVQSIEIYQTHGSSDGPELLYGMEIGGNVTDIVHARNSFLTEICQQPLQSADTLLEMTINVTGVVNEQRAIVGHEWLVYHVYQAEKAVLDVAQELKVLPWVGIALPLNKQGDVLYTEPAGRLFATLPLPLDGTERTGLSFHIHAYFTMEQNRRHLRWPTPEQDPERLDSVPLIWNCLLVKRVIPEAVVAFYKRAIQLADTAAGITPHDLYALLPNPNAVDNNWQPVVCHIYQELFKEACFYSPTNGGTWVTPQQGLLFTEQLPDKFEPLIERILIIGHLNVIKLPQHVRLALGKYSEVQPDPISASTVRDAALNVVNAGDAFKKEDVLLLLRYFLLYGSPDDLLNLPLVPLLSGEMTSFAKTNEADAIFLTSADHPATLLPHLEHRIIDTNLEDDLQALLMIFAQKGTTQVEPLSFKAVLQNVQHVLPALWANTDVVNWRLPERDPSHPSAAWMEQIWGYVQHNHPTNTDWQTLGGLHLLPLDAPRRLCRFSVGQRIILAQNDGHGLPPGICSFLTEAGVIVLSDCAGFVSENRELLDHYVRPPTVEGVIDALIAQSHHLGTEFYKVTPVATMNGQCVRDFLTYLSESSINVLPENKIEFMRHIPFFETVNGSGFQCSMYVSIEEVSVSWPSAVDLPVPCPVQVIHVYSDKVRNILEALNVSEYHKLSFAKILNDVLVPAIRSRKYSDGQVDDLVCYIMDTYPNIIHTDRQLAASLSDIKFVKTRSGQRCSPCELYDPNDFLLCAFLSDSHFPHDKYIKAHLKCLKKFGLKAGSDISLEDFLHIAHTLHTMPELADDFIQLTKKLHACHPSEKWWQQLKDVPFLPSVPSKPEGYPKGLPWKGSEDRLFRPAEVCHIMYIKQTGSVLPLVDLDESILSMLGVKNNPNVENLITQLKEIITRYTGAEKSQYMLLLDDVYRGLARFTGDEIQKALDQCEVTDWVWSGNGFQGVKQFVLTQPELNLAPYIVCIPEEMQGHKNLLYKCGVPETVELNSVLKMIAMNYKTDNTHCAVNVRRDLQMAIDIAFVLCHDNATVHDPLLPIETGDKLKLRLIPASQCTVLDDSSDPSDELHIVHRSVPPEIVTQLLIPTVTHRALDGEEFSIGLESFGQTEPLTTRLRSILEGYTDGLAILKEMIQNADDAGATDICLIYDMRDSANHLHSLLDPGMAVWQGPTLWIYNNSVFTKQDFENIAKLNGATKMEKEDEIGAFGLGFNSVYNLTDVPSILSGDTMAIFDPHTTFLGKAVRDKSKPGLRINTKSNNGKLLRQYPDQFAPWNGVYGCKLEPDSQDTTFKGTLFRLPLRGHKESYCSEISNVRYDHQTMVQLLEMIYNQGSSMLLFTQNVLDITVSLIPNSDVAPSVAKQLFKITKEPIQYLTKHAISCDLSHPSKMKDIKMREFIKECSILKASVKNKGMDGQKLDTVSSMIIASVVTTSEHAKTVLRKDADKTQENWIVAHCIERSNATTGQGKRFTQPAVAGIAIGLNHEDDYYKLKATQSENFVFKGSYFSFLPLPIKCPLPFHINGTFILDQSRRHIVQKTDHDRSSIGGDWNTSLMKGAVCTAYLTAIEALISLTGSTEEDLSEILPWKKEENVISSFSKAFWRKVIDDPESPKIFSAPDGRVSFHNACFLDRTFSELTNNELHIIKQIVSAVLAKKGKSLVTLSHKLEDTISAVDSNMLRSKVITNEGFFLKFFLPNLAKLTLDQKDRDNLLVMALQLKSDSVSNAMKCQACIPVSPNGELLVLPEYLVHPLGRASKLFCSEDSRFPYFRHISIEDKLSVFQKICELGMVNDTLPWSDVLERASSLQARAFQPGDKTNTIKTVNHFIRYLNWKLVSDGDVPMDVKKKLQHEKILPAIERPNDWNINWKSDAQFYSGLELYCLVEPLCACTQIPVLHTDIEMSHDVANLLGIREEGHGYSLNIELLKRQLEEIASNHENLKSASVRKSLHKIYAFLEKECKGKMKAILVRQLLQNERFILASSGHLVQPATCANKLDCEVYPYLNQLSWSLQKYTKLMKAVGVKEEFSSDDFVIAIAKVKEKYGDKPVPRELIGDILNGLLQLKEKNNEMEMVMKCETQLYIPDTGDVLQPLQNICFGNSPHLYNLLPYPQAHQRITQDFAAILGLQDIQTLALLERRQGIPYGQNDNLIEQIHSSLGADRNGNHMLLNLIRNADSSGAGEIHFILDPRSHPTNTVFDRTWESLQGPSLCVYNDARVSKEHLEDLLRKGSAESKPGVLSFDGTGFHSVFHLTDTPSVLATLDNGTETFCVYDPACQYIQGTTFEEPGMQYRDLDLLRRLFPDVFTCYPVQHLEKGTLFRLPLRTSAKAPKSPISKSAKTCKEVHDMLAQLETDAFQALLFMTSLKKILISQVNSSTGELETNEIKCTMSDMSQSELSEFKKHLQSKKKKNINTKIGNLQVPTVKQVSYKLIVSSKTKTERWSVVQQCGIKETDAQHLSMNVREELQAILLGGVAELESVNGKGIYDKSPMTCFIPFAEDTTLPICINGLFAIRHSSSESLPQPCDIRDELNKCMCKIVASAYLTLIMSRKENVTTQCCEQYFNIFPLLPPHQKKSSNVRICSISSIEQLIVQELYATLGEENVIPVTVSREPKIKWTRPCEACFLKPHIHNQDHDLTDVVKGAKLCQLPLADFSTKSWRQFEVWRMINTYCTCDLQYLSPSLLVDFLKSPQICNTENLSQLFGKGAANDGMTIVKSMLNFCKSVSKFSSNLHLLPLLVTSDEKLGVFSEASPVYKSSDLRIVKPCSDKFLHLELIAMFESIQSPVFKDLDLKTFCVELERVLPNDLCRNTPIPWEGQITSIMSKLRLTTIWDCLDRIKDANCEDLKTHAGHLCLVLVQVGCRSYLYPLSKANEVFSNSGYRYEGLQHLVKGDNFPIAKSGITMQTSMLASWKDPHTVAQALYAYQKLHASTDTVASIFKSEDLLQYIIDNIHALTKQIHLLEDLPIFETLSSKFTALIGQCSYVIPSDIPMDDMDFWKTSKPGILFLKEKVQLKALYDKLNCKYWDNAALYVEYIFPQLEFLSEKGRTVHMGYVFRNLQGSSAVMAALRDIECVKNTSGTYCRPCDLYDPHIKLFKVMHQDDLPAAEFGTHDVLPVLRKSGMTCSATKEMLGEYAKQVAISSKRFSNNHSGIILDYIKDSVENNLHPEYLKFLSEIAFIPRKGSLYSSVCPDSTNDVYVTLKGSALEKHRALVSSVVPLISKDCSHGFSKHALSLAGVISEPSYELVARNIKRICENSQENPLNATDQAKRLSAMIDNCYSYITHTIQKENVLPEAKDQLQAILLDCCCIPVEGATTFVKPNQTILPTDYGEEIKPYLFRLPDNLMCNKDLLLLLGLHETPNTQTYQYVLSMIHAKVGRNVINNEVDIKAASQATQQVFKKIQKDDSLDVHQDLWLLSTGNRLCKAQELIYSNNKAIEERIKTSQHILIELNIRDCGEKILEFFPETHRPWLLSAVLKEVVAHVADTNTDVPNILGDRLAANGTRIALARLVNHILLQKTCQSTSDVIEQKIQHVHDAVERIQIRIVRKLKTCLTNTSSVVVGKFEEKYVFGDTASSVFYIEQQTLNCSMSQVYLYKVLADLINKLSDGLFNEHLGVLMVVLSEDTQTIPKRLDEMQIARHMYSVEMAQQYDTRDVVDVLTPSGTVSELVLTEEW